MNALDLNQLGPPSACNSRDFDTIQRASYSIHKYSPDQSLQGWVGHMEFLFVLPIQQFPKNSCCPSLSFIPRENPLLGHFSPLGKKKNINSSPCCCFNEAEGGNSVFFKSLSNIANLSWKKKKIDQINGRGGIGKYGWADKKLLNLLSEIRWCCYLWVTFNDFGLFWSIKIQLELWESFPDGFGNGWVHPAAANPAQLGAENEIWGRAGAWNCAGCGWQCQHAPGRGTGMSWGTAGILRDWEFSVWFDLGSPQADPTQPNPSASLECQVCSVSVCASQNWGKLSGADGICCKSSPRLCCRERNIWIYRCSDKKGFFLLKSWCCSP